MEYNWEELGLPMNWQCSMDEYIYICLYVQHRFRRSMYVHSSSLWRVWPTMAIQKAFTQLLLPSIWHPPSSKANAQSKWLGENAHFGWFPIGTTWAYVYNFSKWKCDFGGKEKFPNLFLWRIQEFCFASLACVFLMWKFYPIILRHTNFVPHHWSIISLLLQVSCA